ncbi:phospholipase B1, membrane-associated [Pleurodeles waltl]|uniref:phospholipase B1, membrane-associated n=1 Tax=Pleurodeles waltl TaxID=8319 RepID=UPI0037093F6F
MVDSMRRSQNEDFSNGWKLVVIFLNAEDPCNFCNTQDVITLQNMDKLARVLDYLQQELPKAIVNLVDFTDLVVSDLSRPSNMEDRESCDCFRDPSRLNNALLRWSFQDALESLLSSGRYEEHEDFTVVLQPPLTTAETRFLGKDGFIGTQCSPQDHPYLITAKNSDYRPAAAPPEKEKETSLAQERNIGGTISCPDMNPSVNTPVSVHTLRPADIKVVAALGDSLTAGNGAGANNLLEVLTQYRGLSWSIGGDGNLSTVTTLPNILREFNPTVQGFSTGKGAETTPNAFFNQAKLGAKSDDMRTQAEILVNLMKNNTKINFTEDWKLLTLFIGGNDLCDICDDLNYYSPENFVLNIKGALDFFHAQVPRMFVNLVSVLHILPLRELYQDNRVSCPRALMRILCGCVVNPADNSTDLETLARYNREYQVKTRQLVDSGRYDTKDDFTVVVQPFLEDVIIPKDKNGLPDSSYFSPDCFHFSGKTHALGAKALWNNMLEPLGEKTDNQSLDAPIELTCPSQEQPFLRTITNSNYTYPTYPTPPTTTTVAQEIDSVHGSQLLCTDRAPSNTTPTSVHALRPADVKVIAAVGDSLTAGNGIGSKPNNVLDVLTQYRGLSWSVGGDHSLQTVTTLPNILREFNPSLTGFSTGVGDAGKQNAFYNQAVPGAKTQNLADQVRKLINLMKTDGKINFENDWKVITVFIGGNDLCAYCTDTNYYSPSMLVSRIREALDILHQEVPKAFVNLAEVMYIMPLRQVVSDDRVKCPSTIVSALCHCVFGVKDNSLEWRKMSDANRAYQAGTRELIDTGRFDTREDFTVVLQPFFRHADIPYLQDGRPDVSFLAPDCFHMSQKSQSQFSRALWNNMLQPIGEKTDVLDFQANLTLSCPSLAEPFLRTYKNSNYSYPGLSPSEKPIENWGSDLMCSESGPSPKIPTSVHQLRPADIKVIGALGDSLTAGFGVNATSLSNLRTEWRGLSWSSGGDGTLDKYTTLPNVLKRFNPNLYGFSTGTGKANARFNVAVSGAKASNMVAQARDLVDRMKQSSEINFQEDWKVITLFIGGNDLCQYCLDRESLSVEQYIKHLQEALDILYKEVPRAFVNMVQILEVEGLREISRQTLGCALLRPNACPCFIKSREGSPELTEMKIVNRNFQEESAALVQSGRYNEREDFTVVQQPFFKNTIVPKDSTGAPDLSFFSVDCFHFSERGHAEMAIALWNNMLEPEGHKQNLNNFTHNRSKLKCPTSENPYLYTFKNSRAPDNIPLATEAPGSAVDTVPFWAPILAAIGGLLVGSAVILIWKSVSSRKQARVKKIRDTELHGTPF